MSLASIATEWTALGVAYALGFATPFVLSLRKQPVQHFQPINFKTGDLLKFTFAPPEKTTGIVKGDTDISAGREEGLINSLLIDWITRDVVPSAAVADISRFSKNLKDAGLSEPQVLRFVQGDLTYLLSNIVIYRELAKRLASCTRGSQLLQQMQLAMYAYCWIYGPTAENYARAFDIARRIDAFKDRWALIPGGTLETLSNAIDANADPLSTAIDPGLPNLLDDIYDNPAIHAETRELWGEIKEDFDKILAILNSHQMDMETSV